MRLFGKYSFETLRDCLQGVFEWDELKTDDGKVYLLELWQFRFIIYPHDHIDIRFNAGKEKGYISFGKIELSK